MTAPAPRLEATTRALLTGSVLGVILAAGNVYTGLKINSIDGGSISAALLGFALFATFKRLERVPYTALENNITQTTASSAAIASYVTGVAGPIPALHLLGRDYPGWAVILWGLAVGLCGIFAATLLRQKLILVEKPPVPHGRGDRRDHRDDVCRAHDGPTAGTAPHRRRGDRRGHHLAA